MKRNIIKKYNHKQKHWEVYGKINVHQAIVDNVLMELVGVSNVNGDFIRGEYLPGAKYTYGIAGQTYFWKSILGGK
jgi:hypothetical protein